MVGSEAVRAQGGGEDPSSTSTTSISPGWRVEAPSTADLFLWRCTRGEPELSSSVEAAVAAAVEAEALTSLFLFFPGSGPSAGATESGGAAMGSVVEEEEPVPLAPLRLASSSRASLLSFPVIESAYMEKGRVR